MSTHFIDFSQYYLFTARCPWAWYERTVNRRERKRDPRQRDDALAIGGLVHAGLEQWYKHGTPEIPVEAITKMTPTPEALAHCSQMVIGYVHTYPREQWEYIHCEKPLRFPLWNQHYGHLWPDTDGYDGLAKLDLYFYIPEDLQIETGLAGYPTTLARGWWIQEYKTKAQSRDVARYIKSWQNNLQASFQILALQHNLATNILARAAGDLEAPVQGVLVNVIEKPTLYIPKRKCKTCQRQWPFSSYLATGSGRYQCPNCGAEQALEPLKDSTAKPPTYFRMIVTRTPEQLAAHRAEIIQVARTMEHMRIEGLQSISPNRETCIDKAWDRECPYFDPHTFDAIGTLRNTLEDENYIEPEDYIGELEETPV